MELPCSLQQLLNQGCCSAWDAVNLSLGSMTKSFSSKSKASSSCTVGNNPANGIFDFPMNLSASSLWVKGFPCFKMSSGGGPNMVSICWSCSMSELALINSRSPNNSANIQPTAQMSTEALRLVVNVVIVKSTCVGGTSKKSFWRSVPSCCG